MARWQADDHVRRRMFCNRRPDLRLETVWWEEDAELLASSIWEACRGPPRHLGPAQLNLSAVSADRSSLGEAPRIGASMPMPDPFPSAPPSRYIPRHLDRSSPSRRLVGLLAPLCVRWILLRRSCLSFLLSMGFWPICTRSRCPDNQAPPPYLCGV